MEESQFATFKPIINFADQSKGEIADYYASNGITPTNQYMSNYLGSLDLNKPAPIPSLSTQESPIKSIREALHDAALRKLPAEGTPAPLPISTESNLSGKQLIAGSEIINSLIKKGLTKEQAAGVAGNLHAESGFDAGILGDNKTSLGLAQ